MRVQVASGGPSLRLCLNDHFNRIDDGKAGANAVYAIDLSGRLAAAHGSWVMVRVAWQDATREGAATVSIDGTVAGVVKAQRAAHWGVNYLRVEVSGAPVPAAVKCAEVQMRRMP